MAGSELEGRGVATSGPSGRRHGRRQRPVVTRAARQRAAAEPTTTSQAPDPGLRWRRAAAFLLGLGGAQLIVYSPLLPLPPGLGGVVTIQLAGVAIMIGPVLTVLGMAAITAAVAVWRGRDWGRIAAAGVNIAILAYQLWYQLAMSGAAIGSPVELAWLLVGLALPLGVSAFIMFVLARRWTPPAVPSRPVKPPPASRR